MLLFDGGFPKDCPTAARSEDNLDSLVSPIERLPIRDCKKVTVIMASRTRCRGGYDTNHEGLVAGGIYTECSPSPTAINEPADYSWEATSQWQG